MHCSGDVQKIQVDQDMLAACRSAYSVYAKKQQEEREAEEAKKNTKEKSDAETKRQQ